MQDPTDPLSVTARHLLKLDPNAYAQLVPSGPGSNEARDLLETTKPAQLLASGAVKRADDGEAMLAGLWLWFDWLDESHTISQGIETPSGSYWHAIMHRREGDYSNSKYWLHRIGRHEIFSPLAKAAHALEGDELAVDVPILFAAEADWDPFRFVDLCQRTIGSASTQESLCRGVQQSEWELLFDHCYRRAIKR